MAAEELLPFSAYERAGTLNQARAALVMGVLWGTPMTILLFAFARPVLGTVETLVLGLSAAAAFGVLWVVFFSREMRRIAQRIYRGDPEIVPPPPDGRFDIRIMGNRLLTAQLGVGGHLYLGPEEWVFVPHRKNRQSDQMPLRLAVNQIRQVEQLELQPRGLARLMSAKPVGVLRIQTDDVFVFIAPNLAEVAMELRRRIP